MGGVTATSKCDCSTGRSLHMTIECCEQFWASAGVSPAPVRLALIRSNAVNIMKGLFKLSRSHLMLFTSNTYPHSILTYLTSQIT